MLHQPCTLAHPQNKGGQNHSSLPQPCLLGGPQMGENAMSPLHAWGSAKQRRDKIRIGCLTPAFSGTHKWAKMLCHTCILGDPQIKGGQNQN